MYRDSYSQQSMPPNLNNQVGGSYDFRNSGMHYKGQGNMEGNMIQNIPPIHQGQSHQIYYDGQNVPQMEQNPYMNVMSVQGMDPNYDFSRNYYWRDMEPKPLQTYSLPPPSITPQYIPQPPNIVQRISTLIKSQLPMLQGIMIQVSSNYIPRVESRRQHSRSRSRSKQRHRKSSDSLHDWLCRKCSFSNYDWRQTCKKCNQPRPSRNFIPGPQDWKCSKCGNINYARRMECNRCKRPKSGSD